jgi:HEPN pEK499 p136
VNGAYTSDRRSEVPVWAFLNAQIVQEAFRSGDLTKAIWRIEESYGLPPNSLPIINLAHVVSLLYCLIVVPKELWATDKLPAALSKINANWLFGLTSITVKSPNFDQDPVSRFFRHLRNAIAHVRFEINARGDFTFWDQKNANSTQNFRAAFTQTNLEQFLSTVGPALANLHFQ